MTLFITTEVHSALFQGVSVRVFGLQPRLIPSQTRWTQYQYLNQWISPSQLGFTSLSFRKSMFVQWLVPSWQSCASLTVSESVSLWLIQSRFMNYSWSTDSPLSQWIIWQNRDQNSLGSGNRFRESAFESANLSITSLSFRKSKFAGLQTNFYPLFVLVLQGFSVGHTGTWFGRTIFYFIFLLFCWCTQVFFCFFKKKRYLVHIYGSSHCCNHSPSRVLFLFAINGKSRHYFILLHSSPFHCNPVFTLVSGEAGGNRSSSLHMNTLNCDFQWQGQATATVRFYANC